MGLCGKLIEPLWGKMEMLTFFILINTSVAFFGTFFYLVLYMATINTDVLFEVHIHGLAGYIAAVSVAVKQMMPGNLWRKKSVNYRYKLLYLFYRSHCCTYAPWKDD